ncbi:MAG: HIT domain-containing protein [Candidatus Glassbacteria bacterium]
MERLWTPWRMEYILSDKEDECIFCTKISEKRDADNFILERGKNTFALLNIYPYNSGHIMIAPNRHVGSPMMMEEEEMMELMRFVKMWEKRIRKVYEPQGLNIGANIGRSAGAGVIGHFHVHVVPRWTGDTSHMTVISNTKVIPQMLEESYRLLLSAIDS